MAQWFETTVKYERVADEGKIIKLSEKYLVDAISFTECEARIIKEMTPFISGEFIVSAIKRYKVNEMFENENADKWFRAKVNFIQLDEEKGVEKKIASYMLIQANDLKESRENLVEGMKGSLADWEPESITETKIIEIFKYEADQLP